MAVTGRFHIKGSFTITGRGLTVYGDITEGKVKVGDYLTFHLEGQPVTLMIGGLGMGRSVGRPTDYVGLTFAHADETERKQYQSLRLAEQDAIITDEEPALPIKQQQT